MDIVFLIIVLLVIAGLIAVLQIGWRIGFVCAMRESVNKFYGARRTNVGRIFLILGCLSLAAGLCTSGYTWYFTSFAQHANGTVIEMREKKHKDPDVVIYAPSVRFQDSAGVQHTFSSGLFQAPPEFHVGENVPVLYLGRYPQTAHIDSFWEVWTRPIVLGILCIVPLAVGLILIHCQKIV